jgi:uncharacterized protein
MSDKPEELSEFRMYGSERIEVIYRKSKPLGESGGGYPELNPGVTIEDGILTERDAAVPLRDGTIIYTDIYRPEGAANVPAIVAWSPFGKHQGYVGLHVHGVPEGTISPMAKFEGPDPAYWCRYGYAIINPDARGSGNSEGDIAFWGTQEGRDCHDLIEWVANLEWESGKVAMSGNSWLAMAQWVAAVEKPPHLAAIAPWEGFTDFYRHQLFPGGIPEPGFIELIFSALSGRGRIEDIPAMMREYPFMNGYWEDKIPRLEEIQVPAYIVAGWQHLHLLGTLDAFRRISSPNKWLRFHNTFEWPDYYTPQNLEDLRHFFDRYLKGIRNGWEFTPRVRLSVLDPGGVDQINRPEQEWPLARTEYQKLFLDGSKGKLCLGPVKRASEMRYGADTGQGAFTVRFDKDTELTGYMKLRLWVQAHGSDDMDLFVYVRKLDREGNFVPSMVLGKPHPGAQGWLRVSRREIDAERSTPSEPVLVHRSEQFLGPGEIVPVEIGIWPTSMLWHKGEQLSVVVSGHFLREPGWFEPFRYDLRNRGEHIIHTGGKYDSHLLVPVIPHYP